MDANRSQEKLNYSVEEVSRFHWDQETWVLILKSRQPGWIDRLEEHRQVLFSNLPKHISESLAVFLQCGGWLRIKSKSSKTQRHSFSPVLKGTLETEIRSRSGPWLSFFFKGWLLESHQEDVSNVLSPCAMLCTSCLWHQFLCSILHLTVCISHYSMFSVSAFCRPSESWNGAIACELATLPGGLMLILGEGDCK